jgi:hypothetical protein
LIGEFLGRADIVTFTDEGDAVTVAGEDVTIEAIVSDIGLSTHEPFDVNITVIEVEVVAVEVGGVPFLVPVELVGKIAPESL